MSYNNFLLIQKVHSMNSKLSSSNPLQMELKVKSRAPIVADSAQKHRRVHSIVIDSDMEMGNDEVDNMSTKRSKTNSGEKMNRKKRKMNTADDLTERLLSLSPPREVVSTRRMLPVSVQRMNVSNHKTVKNSVLYLPKYKS